MTRDELLRYSKSVSIEEAESWDDVDPYVVGFLCIYFPQWMEFVV